MTKQAMLKAEDRGLFSVDPEWEEISPGLYSFGLEIEGPSASISGREKAKTRELLKGLYEVITDFDKNKRQKEIPVPISRSYMKQYLNSQMNIDSGDLDYFMERFDEVIDRMD